jgi:prefoldin subunit 5
MAFEPSDFEDLVRFLDAHPDMRDQLRRRILSDEFLRLPLEIQSLGEGMAGLRSAIDQLTEAQDRTEQSIVRLDQAILRLTEAQARTEARIDKLVEAQARTEARVGELAAAQSRTEQTLIDLADGLRQTNAKLQHLTIRVDSLGGRAIEAQFRDRADAYFGHILRRSRLVKPDSLLGVEDALDSGAMTDLEYNGLRLLDAIVQGRDTREAGGPETLLALEVSLRIDNEDVIRALERAETLRKAGYRAFGAVGGDTITPRAAEMAEQQGVLVRLAPPEGMPKEQTA